MENRRYQRLMREVAVDISYVDSDTGEHAHVERSCSRNLSAVGLLVITDKKLEFGSIVEVDFFLPGSPEHFRLRAKVIRVEELEKDKFYEIGVEFTNIDDISLAKINALVIQESSEE